MNLYLMLATLSTRPWFESISWPLPGVHLGLGSGPSRNAWGDGRGQKQARNRKQTTVFHTVPPACGTSCPFGPRRSDALEALNRRLKT